jgi:hypothetical protein
LDRLCSELFDYRTGTFLYARAILETDPNNLAALFVAARLSSLEDERANAIRLSADSSRFLIFRACHGLRSLLSILAVAPLTGTA